MSCKFKKLSLSGEAGGVTLNQELEGQLPPKPTVDVTFLVVLCLHSPRQNRLLYLPSSHESLHVEATEI